MGKKETAEEVTPLRRRSANERQRSETRRKSEEESAGERKVL